MRGLGVLVGVVVSAMGATVATAAPALESTHTFPTVVPAAGPSAVVIVARTTEPTTGMRFVYEGAGAGEPVALQRIATDVFAGVLYGPRLLDDYDDLTSVDRALPGHFEIEGTSGKPFLTLAVDDGSFPDVPVSSLAADVRCAPHVLNIDLGGDPWAGEDSEPALRRAYAFLPDAFDTANVVLANPSQRENRHRVPLRNTTSGIGRPMATSPGRYGSASRLLGLSYFPIAELFDLASPGATHELGHQWISYIGKAGQPDAYLDNGDGAHWPPSDMASGPMGWNLVSNPQGLEFPFALTDVGPGPSGHRQYRIDRAPVSQRFHPLDLYLMGLIPPAEVPPFAVVAPSEAARFENGVPAGETVLGKQLTIADVIASEGQRMPAGAPRTFTNLSIVVTRTGLLSDRELSFFDAQARRGEATAPLLGHSGRLGTETYEPFHIATSGRGSLATGLGCPGTPAPRATLPGLFRGLNVAIQTSALDADGQAAALREGRRGGGGVRRRGPHRDAGPAGRAGGRALRQRRGDRPAGSGQGRAASARTAGEHTAARAPRTPRDARPVPQERADQLRPQPRHAGRPRHPSRRQRRSAVHRQRPSRARTTVRLRRAGLSPGRYSAARPRRAVPLERSLPHRAAEARRRQVMPLYRR